MTTLNRDAAAAALAAGPSAMTDVTGFGLLGHLHEMCEASGVAAELSAAAVPAIDGVLDLLRSEEPPIAGGSRRNREWVEPWVDWDARRARGAALAPLRRDDLGRPARGRAAGTAAHPAFGSAGCSTGRPGRIAVSA